MKHCFRAGLVAVSFLLLIISCSPAITDTRISTTNSKTTTPTPIAHTPTPDPYVITSNNIGSISVLEKIENKSYQSMDWSPDSQYLYVYRSDIVDIFNGDNFDFVDSKEMSLLLLENDCETCFPSYKEIKSSLDGHFIGTCNISNPNRITIRNVKSDQVVNSISNLNLTCPEFVISSKHQKVAAFGNDNSLLILNLENAELKSKIDISGGKALAISPTGDTFAIATSTNELLIYNFEGQLIKKIPSQIAHAGYNNINSLAYNPSGDLLAVSTDQRMVQFINVSSGKLLNAYTINETVIETKFSPDGKKIAIRADDGTIHIWVLQNYAQLYPTVTTTPTSELVNNYGNLPYDQYILYSNDLTSMRVRSINGSINQPLTNRLLGLPISADGRILRLYNQKREMTSDMLNLIDSHTITGVIGYPSPKPSPNGDWFLKTRNSSKLGNGILVYNSNNDIEHFIPIDIPDFPADPIADIIDSPVWSPNGKEIIYLRHTGNAGNGISQPWDVLPSNGLYIIDFSCVENFDDCSKSQEFIYSSYKFDFVSFMSISPDSRYAIVHGGENLILFDLQNQTVQKINTEIDGISNYYSTYAYISPDNQWVLFSTSDGNAYIQPLFGGQTTKIMDSSDYKYLLGWLTAPYLQIGDSFKVLPAGDHVYIRENPDLGASEITFLISGNTFTVLDGPVQEDGYTWWYVESDVDSVEGWISEFYGWYEKVEVDQ